MATISQVRGMLLEEAVLQLLKTTGYTVVEKAGSDPTLHDGHSGLEVCGRGGRHQIDAVADFSVSAPFSHPQRLFVEAKCFSSQYPVGLPIIRNAVGVLKDVLEWWNPPSGPRGIATTGRYHYQYALFSASGYTLEAERYAFAQDIYLIPYERSQFISPVIQAIRQMTHTRTLGRKRGMRLTWTSAVCVAPFVADFKDELATLSKFQMPLQRLSVGSLKQFL